MERVDRAAILGRAAVGLVDVDALVGERLRDVREQAGLVGAQDLDRDLVLGLRVAVPLDVDAPLGIEIEPLVAIAAVHGDAAAARDEADDRIAGERRAALREPHEDVLLAGDLDSRRRLPARDLAEQRLQHALGLLRQLVPSLRELGQRLLEHLLRGDLAVADLDDQLVDGHALELGGRHLELLLGARERGVVLAQRLVEQVGAERDGLVALLGAQQVPDLGARLRRLDELEPVLVRLLVRVRDDLDRVAVAELVAQRDDHAVDARARAVVADRGVNGVGEVDRAAPLRQRLHVATRCEHVDLVAEQVDLDALEELGGIAKLLLRLHELPEPAELLVGVGRDRLALLVLPVRGNAVLRDEVHLARADLDLDALAARTDHRGVQ